MEPIDRLTARPDRHPILIVAIIPLGATFFFSPFLGSGILPRIPSVWGLVAATLALAGIVISILGYTVPIVVFLPNLPFELTTGVFVLAKGTRDGP